MTTTATWTEDQHTTAVERIVAREAERGGFVSDDDVLDISIDVLGFDRDAGDPAGWERVVAFQSALIDEVNGANEAAAWWDSVGKAEWKGEV